MAKESKSQQEIVERVMHEFKHGELESSAGETVKSRRQAIAIGLSEAGASNRVGPARNRGNEKRTKARESAGQTAQQREGPSKATLYAEAKKRNVAGRSTMSKGELMKALGK